jgi:hypothetical protein
MDISTWLGDDGVFCPVTDALVTLITSRPPLRSRRGRRRPGCRGRIRFHTAFDRGKGAFAFVSGTGVQQHLRH